MTVPEIVRERLGDEAARVRVPLGGDDELFVTPSRTLVYRAEGLLSSESVEEYPHDAEEVRLTEGRRKSTIALDYGLDGERNFTIPSNRIDDALPPVLGGVLLAADVTDGDETVEEFYRLGELTIVITEGRVVKHIGEPLWDDEYEEFEFEQVTGIDIEEGDVSSQIIIEVDGRPQRIKTPSGDARGIREQIEQSLLAYHEVGSLTEFAAAVSPEEESDVSDESDTEATDTSIAQEGTPSSPADDEGESEMVFSATETIAVGESSAESSGQPVDIAKEVANLRESVNRQNELLEQQQETIEQLIEELRQGR